MVDGFVAGLHRSPDFGFSQEFAEYRAYTPGDDLRHVDWNVFARTERDVSQALSRRDQLPGDHAAGLQPLDEVSARTTSTRWNMRAFSRRPSATWRICSATPPGLIVFDDEVRNFVPPSTRQGQLARLLHAIEKAEVGDSHRLREALRPPARIPAPPRPGRRDLRFLGDRPSKSSRPSRRCASAATKWCCFTCSIRRRSGPSCSTPCCSRIWKPARRWKSRRTTRRNEYPAKIDAHLEDIQLASQRRGHRLFPDRHQPSAGRRAARVSGHPEGEDVNGFLHSLVSGGSSLAVGLPIWLHLLKRHKTDPKLFPSLMFFENRETEFGEAPPPGSYLCCSSCAR